MKHFHCPGCRVTSIGAFQHTLHPVCLNPLCNYPWWLHCSAAPILETINQLSGSVA